MMTIGAIRIAQSAWSNIVTNLKEQNVLLKMIAGGHHVLESLKHICPQWCNAVLIGLVGACSGPTQGLHCVPLIPKRRNGRTFLFRSNISASTCTQTPVGYPI